GPITAMRTAASGQVLEVGPTARVDADIEVDEATHVGRIGADERCPPARIEVELLRSGLVLAAGESVRPECRVGAEEVIDARQLAGGVARAGFELQDQHSRPVDVREELLELHPVAPDPERSARGGGTRAPGLGLERETRAVALDRVSQGDEQLC